MAVPVVKDELVGHYEELRRHVLDSAGGFSGGLGLALFLEQGMAAWIEAWSRCVPPAARPLETTSVPSATALALDAPGDLARILASMLLSGRREAPL
jgi:hypothetical protein